MHPPPPPPPFPWLPLPSGVGEGKTHKPVRLQTAPVGQSAVLVHSIGGIVGTRVGVFRGPVILVRVGVFVGTGGALAQPQSAKQPAPAISAHDWSQKSAQQKPSALQTQDSQPASEQPGPSSASRPMQQLLGGAGVGVAVGVVGASHSQDSAHSVVATDAHSSSHTVSQQNASKPQTQLSQVESPQPATSRARQQSRAATVAVGVAFAGGVSSSVGVPFDGGRVGRGVGNSPQAQTSAHLPFACVTQVLSQDASQQKASAPQTQLWQAEISQPVPACSEQQSPLPPGVGSPQTSVSSQSGSSQSTMPSASLSKPSAQRASSVRGQRLAWAQALSVHTAIEQPSGSHTASR